MATIIPVTSDYVTGTWQYYFNWDNSIYGPMNIDQLKVACHADADTDLEIIVTDAIGDQVVQIPAPYHGSFSANIRVPATSVALTITPSFGEDDNGDSIKSIQLVLIKNQ